MVLISISSTGMPQAAASRLCTSRACASASGEPREPIRRTGELDDCGIALRRSGMTSVYNTSMVILGIETTCDETAAALVERGEGGKGRIMANIVLSQVSEHAAFGGVVPEIAARAHVEALDRIIAKAMAEAGCSFAALDGVAAAAGPGLIGGLIVGDRKST